MKTYTKSLYLLVCIVLFVGRANAQTILYGLTSAGGSSGHGALIAYNPATDSERAVYSFSGADSGGTVPNGSLVFDPDNGLFYGMTYGDNFGNYDVIFSFDPTTETVKTVWNFSGPPNDGAEPQGNLVYNAGTKLLYGLTTYGGKDSSGAIISFNPATGRDSVLYSFRGGKDGAYPFADLVYDTLRGLYYGTTYYGDSADDGTFFVFNPVTDSERVVYSFDTSDNLYAPVANFTYDPANGMYYTTAETSAPGVIMGFDPANDSVWVAYRYQNPPGDAGYPWGTLTYDPANGLLYGMTTRGGTNNTGAIYYFNPTTGTDSLLWSLGSGSDGSDPYGNLLYDTTSDLFYGMTQQGGKNGKGAIISFSTVTGGDSVLWSFGSDTDGATPLGNLVLYNPVMSCRYSLSTASFNCPYTGANTYDSVGSVTASANYCPWTAMVTSGNSWLSTTSSDTGNGKIGITVTANTTGSSRTGTISIGGQTLTITQNDTLAGIATISSAGITLFPNPTKGVFTITGLSNKQVITVYNSLGQKVYTAEANTSRQRIDLSSYANGVYIIRLTWDDGTPLAERKIVKE